MPATNPVPPPDGPQWDDADTSIAMADIIEMLSKRLVVDVVMKMPVLVLPVSARSSTALVLALGGLSVVNELRVVPGVVSNDNLPAVMDCTNMNWTSVSISRYQWQ